MKKYAISFENKVLDFPVYGKTVLKHIYVNSEYLEIFMNFWRNSKDINEGLLPDIDDALNGVREEIENGSETIEISIFRDLVDFYTDGKYSISIPTTDFKEIVVGWRDFLDTKPYNGAKS